MRYRSEWIWVALGVVVVLVAILAAAWTRVRNGENSAPTKGFLHNPTIAYAPEPAPQLFRQRWAPVSPMTPKQLITPNLPTRAHEAPEPAERVQRVRELQKRNYKRNRGICAAHGMRKVFSANKRSWRCKK